MCLYSNGSIQINHDGAVSEWKEFLSKRKDVSEFLLASAERKALLPIMSELIARGLMLPIATADCEHGLSTMNSIETAPYCRLKPKTLE